MHGTTVRIESGLGCPVLEISAQSSLSTNACFTSRYLVFRWQSGQVTRRMDNNVGSVFLVWERFSIGFGLSMVGFKIVLHLVGLGAHRCSRPTRACPHHPDNRGCMTNYVGNG